jgi:predicted permease
VSTPGGAPQPGLWERLGLAVFRLFPGSYRRRHGEQQTMLTKALLDAQLTQRLRERVARRVALDALRTLPRAWIVARTASHATEESAATRSTGSFHSSGASPRIRIRQHVWGWVHDVRHAMRSVVREPGLSLAIVTTLAIGIGANAAVFGIVDRLLLSGPPHLIGADKVVRVYATSWSTIGGERTTDEMPYPLYEALRERSSGLREVAGFIQRGQQVLSEGDKPADEGDEIAVAGATASLFPMLGVQPLVGRFFLNGEDRPPTGELVAVLGESLWESRFGRDPDVLGRSVSIGRFRYRVVGIAPKGFTGPQFERVDAWVPLSSWGAPNGYWTGWNSNWVQVVGRLPDGELAEHAAEGVQRVFDGAYDQKGSLREARLQLLPIRYDALGRDALEARVSRWLQGVCLVLLLIACANVASLQLARAVSRERALAVHLALGSGRARLVRIAFARSLILALMSGVAALFVAHAGGLLLRKLLAPSIAWDAGPLDGRVLGFALLLALAAAIVGGVLPAFLTLRRNQAALRPAMARATARSRTLASLGTAQAAATMLLLVGAGLFAKSLANVLAIPLGMEPDRVFSVSRVGGGSFAAPTPFYTEALKAVEGLPVVDAAAVAIGSPLASTYSVRLFVDGWDSIPPLPGGEPVISAVTPEYFRAVGTKIVSGRAFTPSDGAGELVAIVNETMAKTLWPTDDPLQKCVRIRDPEAPCARVVGVVEDVKRRTIQDLPAFQYYVPIGQERGISGSVLLVRPRGEVDGAIAEIRAALGPIAGPSAYVRITPLAERLDPQIRPWRAGAILLSVLGALALGLAAFGVYGVVAYAVAQRTHEMGIRLALGARAGEVCTMVVREGLLLAMLGVGIGVGAALALARVAEPALFNTSPKDPTVITGAAVILIAAAAVAAIVPALKAARVDPLISLKGE